MRLGMRMALLPVVLAAAAAPCVALTLAQDGRPSSAIVLAANAAEGERTAAHEVQTFVRKMTGAELPIKTQGEAVEGGVIRLGHTLVARDVPELATLDRDGIVLRTVGDSTLIITGVDEVSDQLAVYRFLYLFGGVRWFVPGDIGECVPEQGTFSVENVNVVEVPDMKSRLYSAACGWDGGVWELRNLMRRRYEFHHALFGIFVPSKLYDEHPDWFPLIGGKRFKPADGAESWQPCFGNPEVAEYAAKVIIERKDANPELATVSIGVNDGGGYCECDRCKALDGGKERTWRGRPDYSNRFFTFANRVAEIVGQKYPDLSIGCLAYAMTENVPDFPVNPMIRPYLCTDRSQWRDPAFKREDQDLLRRWSKTAKHMGTYDYWYGAGYAIPRAFPHLQKDALQFARDQGVDGVYVEIYENYSLGGPKAYVGAQLMWDVDQDVGKLLGDFYTRFFGPAADPMKRYFQRCEEQWMRQEGKAVWIHWWFDPSQFALFPPDVCKELRGYLDDAARRADSDLIRRRVQLFQDGLTTTELWSRLYFDCKELDALDIRSAAEVTHAGGLLVAFGQTQDALDKHNEEVVAKDKLLQSPIAFETRAHLSPTGAMSRVAIWCRQNHEPLLATTTFGRVAHSSTSLRAAARAAGRLSEGALDDAPNLIRNPGFEATAVAGGPQEGVGWQEEGAPPDWRTWQGGGSVGDLRQTDETAHTGAHSIMLRGALNAVFLQTVPVEAGKSCLCEAFAKGRVGQSSGTQLVVKWQNEQGWVEKPEASAALPAGTWKDWRPLSVLFVVPEGVTTAVIMAYVLDQGAGDAVYFDDFSLKAVK